MKTDNHKCGPCVYLNAMYIPSRRHYLGLVVLLFDLGNSEDLRSGGRIGQEMLELLEQVRMVAEERRDLEKGQSVTVWHWHTYIQGIIYLYVATNKRKVGNYTR